MAAASSYFDQVQKIYTAFYQRPADSGGLLYWSQMAAVNGGDFGNVIDAFAKSAEATALYGSVTAANIGDVIDKIYNALFGRSADTAGKQFYVDGFAAGTFTAGKIAMNILDGAKNGDLIAIANKTAAANMFTAAVDGRSMTDAGFGTGKIFAVDYSGNADETAARTWLAKVKADSNTIPTASEVMATVKAEIAGEGGSFTLTAAPAPADNLIGTSGSDVFLARTVNNANTLQDGDRIDGGAGADTLYADMTGTGVAITPIFTNLESVVIRAQSTTADPINGNNMTSRPVQIDAQRSLGVNAADQVTAAAGVTRWESNNSRSDVIIEDVRIGNSQKTSDITIAMVETDPGNVDYAVYFNQHSLRNAGSSTSSLKVFVMDTQAAKKVNLNTTQPSADVMKNLATLTDAAFNGFQFTTDSNAVVTLGGVGSADAKAIQDADTYAKLEAAFNAALKSQGLDAKYQVKLVLTANMTAEVLKGADSTDTDKQKQASSFENMSGMYFEVTSASEKFSDRAGAYKWIYEDGSTAPSVGSIAQSFNAGTTGTTELVTSKVILDDVGMGSTGGDLVIGGMSVGETSTSRGVERFEIEVRDNSKLQTINSTNNALREVTIKNGAISRTVGDAYTNYLSGDLTVNGNANVVAGGVAGNDAILKGVDEGSPAADHHGAFGFTDVRLIDGHEMTGKLAFTAQITQDTIAKYITLVDTQPSPTGDVAGSGNVNFNVKGANFIYTGGSNANGDTMTVDIDGGVAASRSTVVSGQSDFTFNIDGGAGNDVIWVRMASASGAPGRPGNTDNWYNNQDLNNNVTVSGGEGNDIIRTPGAGDKNILGGAGNDWIFSDNSGVQAPLTMTTAVGYNMPGHGQWIFNADNSDTTVAALTAARNINNVRSDINDSYTLYKSKLMVTFKGISSKLIEIADTATYKTTDFQINQAIKKAINEDATLKALLVAEDGPGASLIVKSLIDGVMTPATDLGITWVHPVAAAAATTNPNANTLSSVDVTGAAAAYGLTGAAANETNVLAEMAKAATLYTGNADYSPTVMATDGFVNVTGVDSTSTTDNLILPGVGDDIIVLGTAGTNTATASKKASSNETIKFESGFGNDVIVNFSTAGSGVDHLDFTALNGTAVGGLATDKSIIIETPPVVTSTGAIDKAKIVDKFNANGNITAQNHVYVAVTATNMATVYSVIDAAGTTGSSIQEEGTINLAGASWLAIGADANKVFVNSSAAGYIPNGNEGGAVVGTGGGTTPTPTYAVAAGATSNNEGTSATFTVTTTNVANGTVLNYTLSGTGITAADVTGGLTGTVTINNNGTGTITVLLAADTTTEGAETLKVDLATTAGGTSMANASTIIADTSIASASIPLTTGIVPATAAADVFVYDYKMVPVTVNGVTVLRATKAGGGEVTITGFDTTKDKLVFNDVGDGTVYTQAQFVGLQVPVQVPGVVPGVVPTSNPFADAAQLTGSSVYFDPDAAGVIGGVTLVGITSLDSVVIETKA